MPERKNGSREGLRAIERQMSELLLLQAWAVKRHAEQDERHAAHEAEMTELRKEWLTRARRMEQVEIKLDQVIATLNEQSRILISIPEAVQKRIGFEAKK